MRETQSDQALGEKEFVDSLTHITKKSRKIQKLGKARAWGSVKIVETLFVSPVLRHTRSFHVKEKMVTGNPGVTVYFQGK